MQESKAAGWGRGCFIHRPKPPLPLSHHDSATASTFNTYTRFFATATSLSSCLPPPQCVRLDLHTFYPSSWSMLEVRRAHLSPSLPFF